MDTPKVKSTSADEAVGSVADDDDREPTKGEIMDDIRQGLRDVLAGYEGRDAMEFLEELEREAMVDADES